MSYAPLDSQSLFSTAFRAGPLEWAVWTAILAAKDQDGFVSISPDALAALWTCDVGPIQKAWDVHASPDPKSKNKEYEGRRIIPMDDGRWLVVSHEYYRDKHREAARKEASRVAKARQRAKVKGEDPPEKYVPQEIPYEPVSTKSGGLEACPGCGSHVFAPTETGCTNPECPITPRADKKELSHDDIVAIRAEQAVEAEEIKLQEPKDATKSVTIPESVQPKPKKEDPDAGRERCGQIDTRGQACKKWKFEGRQACLDHLQQGNLGATPPLCAAESCAGFAATPNTSFCMEHYVEEATAPMPEEVAGE